MKFKAGDYFKVTENGLLGQVVGISFNSLYQCQEYVVKWPGLSYEESYPVDECDPIWELEPCPVAHSFLSMKLSNPIEFIPVNITIDTSGPVTVQCNGHHTWVDVGFHHTKEVCKYCNVEKGRA